MANFASRLIQSARPRRRVVPRREKVLKFGADRHAALRAGPGDRQRTRRARQPGEGRQIQAPERGERAIEGIASGDIEGRGRWTFITDGSVTIVRFEWQVRTTPVWMNFLALFARPLFKWNHDSSMRQGGEALARRLNARLVDIAPS